MPTPTLPGIWADDQTLVEATDPQWLEGFQYLETTNNGKPRTYDLDYPLKKITEGLIWALNEIETMKNEQAESIGDVYYRAVDDSPSHSLYCDGSAVSRTTYADLFAKIGTTYGAGDGSTTFNVPDLRGEFIRGWDDGRGADPSRVFGSYARRCVLRSIAGSFNGTGAVKRIFHLTGVFAIIQKSYPPDGLSEKLTAIVHSHRQVRLCYIKSITCMGSKSDLETWH